MMLLFLIPQQYNNLYFIDVLLLLHPILNYFVFLIYIRLKKKSGKEYNYEKYLVEYINRDSRYKIKPLRINYFENSLTLTMHFRPRHEIYALQVLKLFFSVRAYKCEHGLSHTSRNNKLHQDKRLLTIHCT